VNSVAFSHDSKQIVSGSSDQTICIWDAETGKNVGDPLAGHTSWVSSVAFSHDGKQIVSSSCDQTIHIWDAETGQNISLFDVLVFTQEGWIYGKEKELLLWVPPLHQPTFHWRYTLRVLGVHETILDLRHITWGEQWTHVKGPK
ncbi:hypothetical protein M422DRAFT_178418, partial [Sphaerobolus stellatus SS14]